jgi:hypothetical protein
MRLFAYLRARRWKWAYSSSRGQRSSRVQSRWHELVHNQSRCRQDRRCKGKCRHCKYELAAVRRRYQNLWFEDKATLFRNPDESLLWSSVTRQPHQTDRCHTLLITGTRGGRGQEVRGQEVRRASEGLKRLDSLNIEIWCGLPNLRSGDVHDKTTREPCCDANFADDRQTRKSQQGHLIFYDSDPIIIVWKNNRQRTILLSSFYNWGWTWQVCQLCKIITPYKWGYWKTWDPHSTVLTFSFEENRSMIAICTNSMSPGNTRTKHVDLKIKWLLDHQHWRDIKIYHAPTQVSTWQTYSPRLYPKRPSWDV